MESTNAGDFITFRNPENLFSFRPAIMPVMHDVRSEPVLQFKFVPCYLWAIVIVF